MLYQAERAIQVASIVDAKRHADWLGIADAQDVM
jgi:hypothetical protein